MLVGDLFDYQPARFRFIAKPAYGHAAVRKAKLDRVVESERFV
jgi:hypothetical protein